MSASQLTDRSLKLPSVQISFACAAGKYLQKKYLRAKALNIFQMKKPPTSEAEVSQAQYQASQMTNVVRYSRHRVK